MLGFLLNWKFGVEVKNSIWLARPWKMGRWWLASNGPKWDLSILGTFHSTDDASSLSSTINFRPLHLLSPLLPEKFSLGLSIQSMACLLFSNFLYWSYVIYEWVFNLFVVLLRVCLFCKKWTIWKTNEKKLGRTNFSCHQ